MKTTIELPDDLYRRAKAEAARRGCRVTDLIAEGLRLLLEAQLRTTPQASLADLMKGARGVVNSGVPDLGSNPDHLLGFGRAARRDR